MKQFRLCVTCFLPLMLAAMAQAQTPYPMLMSLKPVAAQAGQTSEHTISSRYSMYGAFKVLVTGEGVTGEIVHPEKKAKKPGEKPPNLQSLKVRFTVAADAKPGVRDFRIATPQGASTLGQLVIVRDAVTAETGDNNTIEKAQSITLPSTVCGAIEKNEDVDFFKFKVEAGTALSFHVRSQRLQNKIHDLQRHVDPIITLRNSSGSTLAASDNYFFGDPCLSHRFQQAGEYFLEIRDVRYQGNGYWQYCIEISDRPFVSNAYPMGIARGNQAKFQLIGFQIPDDPMLTFPVPKDLSEGRQSLSLPLGNGTTNPVPVVISDLPLVTEAENENNAPDKGQPFSVPAGINGRIEKEADIDCYTFEAKKAERFSFEVIARRQQSALDSHLRILDAKGKQLAVNDDMRLGKRGFQDSWLENWSAPADGKYTIEIRDVHLRGGPQHVYFVQVTRSQPYFELFADTDKTQLTPGTNGAIFVRVFRKNGFQGEVQLNVAGLPEGVTATCGRILAGGQDGCIILEAAKNAPMSAANIEITGTATHKMADGNERQLTARAVPTQETYMPGGGRNHWPVIMHTVAVGQPLDVRSMTLSAAEIALKPGESKRIDVSFERAAGFTKNVTLDVMFRHLGSVYGNSLPKGVTMDAGNSKTLITGKESKGHITLKAAKDAPPVQKQQIAVMANVSINFVMKATYSSKPLMVTVIKP